MRLAPFKIFLVHHGMYSNCGAGQILIDLNFNPKFFFQLSKQKIMILQDRWHLSFFLASAEPEGK